MSKSGELSLRDHEIAASLRKIQPDYRYESPVKPSELSEKVFVATIGPTGSGKSTLTDEVIHLAPEFAPIGTTTTRARRASDPVNYRTANEGVTHESMYRDVLDQKLVNFSVFDTDHIYGTAPEDIHDYAIGPILSDSVENLWTAGFKGFYPVFLVARGALYQRRLEQERLSFPDISKRLNEAMGSLAFARMNVGESWLNFIDTGDSAAELTAAAHDVIKISQQGTHPIMTTPAKLALLTEMEKAVQNVHSQLR